MIFYVLNLLIWEMACGILCLASWPPVLSIYLQISGFHSLGLNNIPMYNCYKFLFTKEITKCFWSWVISKHVQIVSLVSCSKHFCIEIIFLCLKKKATDGFGTSLLSLMMTGRVKRAILWKPNADVITSQWLHVCPWVGQGGQRAFTFIPYLLLRNQVWRQGWTRYLDYKGHIGIVMPQIIVSLRHGRPDSPV